ncbi:3-methyl-2-oxobutanoate dehydrogenase subunit alpha [Arthrobacter sp. 9V]|uniref:pyruvate dehydrogenase (acetyl-transferring) E1 component subunit alpha n=1 Tax=Arthrobacter sp. 9V TaxID=2653132 RepID=UPI0012F120F0|nr:pyruvate dehydrogenase (acetyl-transferring) E1 component subunit alpha [Arthrobacter sp. 9V]VXB51237.1 3-methyl-2-oxobutanoate dehydrogenase subunit alpha [Arthrobacter sp. 9V]
MLVHELSLASGEQELQDPSGEDLVQLISPEGRRRKNSDFDPWVEDVTDTRLASLYEDMVVIRRIDTEATYLQRQGELALWPPLLGQEAAQVGSGRALRNEDFVFPSYRENGVAYCRGVDLGDLVRVWRGNAHSGWDPFQLNMATPQVIIGAQTLHATGYAMGIQQDGSDAVALAYFGDGATSQGDVNEAMVFAASFRVPVIFFCQNNQWAISEPVGLQAQVSLSSRPLGFGIPSVRVDGNDVLAVLAATRLALHRARTDGGPTFIEAVTYRMGPHTTADDPTRYRDPLDLEMWAAKDPIARLEALLKEKGALTPELESSVAAKADGVAKEMREACITMPPPAALDLFSHVYSEPHSALETQKTNYARYLQTFEGDPVEGMNP